ncbi:MAG: hypothetical protein F6K11_21965 [Leptolyngbya sp. SIO3F4]|nr:hypothetical protein [Leptolyngbya sp. SIO3F4]
MPLQSWPRLIKLVNTPDAMFLCTIELLLPYRPENSEPEFLTICKYDFVPNLQINDEIRIYKKFEGKEYHFKAKVTGRDIQVHSSDTTLAQPKETLGKDLFWHRFFVEAEDRDFIVDIAESLRRRNS